MDVSILRNRVLLAFVFLATSFLVMLHQYITCGVWFTVSDLASGLHHETFVTGGAALSVGLLMSFLAGSLVPVVVFGSVLALGVALPLFFFGAPFYSAVLLSLVCYGFGYLVGECLGE